MIVDDTGYIVDKEIRNAYLRISDPENRPFYDRTDRVKSAEAFLKLCIRFDSRGELWKIKSLL